MAALAIERGLVLRGARRGERGWVLFSFEAEPFEEVQRQWEANQTTVDLRLYLAALKLAHAVIRCPERFLRTRRNGPDDLRAAATA